MVTDRAQIIYIIAVMVDSWIFRSVECRSTHLSLCRCGMKFNDPDSIIIIIVYQ